VSVDEYADVEAIDTAASSHNLLGHGLGMSITTATSPEIVVGVVGLSGPYAPSYGGASWAQTDAQFNNIESMTTVFEDSSSAGVVNLWATATLPSEAEFSLSEVGLFAYGEFYTASAPSYSSPCGHSGNIPQIDHVVLIIDENHSTSQIIDTGKAPYISFLAHACGFADDYTAATHPSLPNYIALLGGKPPITGDCDPIGGLKVCGGGSPTVPYTKPDVFGQVIADGCTSRSLSPSCGTEKSWLGNMKSAHNTFANREPVDWEGDTHTVNMKQVSWHTYAAHHNPQLYFTDVGINTGPSNTAACNSDDDYMPTAGPTTWAPVNFGTVTLPEFSVIVGDNQQNMHDGTVGAGDTFINTLMGELSANSEYTNGKTLVMLTWDEGQKNKNTTGISGLDGKPIVPQDKPCYDPDSPQIKYSDITQPTSNPGHGEQMTPGVYGGDGSGLPESCMVPLIVMNYFLAQDSTGQGKYGISGSIGPDHDFLNHYDTLYSMLGALGLNRPCDLETPTSHCYQALKTSGTGNVDTWSHPDPNYDSSTGSCYNGTNCSATFAHSPTDWRSYFHIP